MTIKHSEYIVSVDWTTHPVSEIVFRMNPGNLPWASALATRFEFYRFDEVRVEYIPQCPVTTPGAVALRWEPDIEDNPLNIDMMLNGGYVFNGNVFEKHSIEFKPPSVLAIPWKHTSPFSIDPIADRLNDSGALHLYTENVTSLVGRIKIHYTLSFRTPQIERYVAASVTASSSVAAFNGGTKYGIDNGATLEGAPTNLVEIDPNDGTTGPTHGTAGMPAIKFNRDYNGTLAVYADATAGDTVTREYSASADPHVETKDYSPEIANAVYSADNGAVNRVCFLVDVVARAGAIIQILLSAANIISHVRFRFYAGRLAPLPMEL
jgi:hypothetical protein